MEISKRKLAAIAGASVMGLAVIGAAGAAMSSDKHNPGKSASAYTEEVKSVNTVAEDNASETEKLEFLQFRKAGIDEYDMTPVQKTSASKSKKEADDDHNDSAASFSMVIPEDNTKIYDPDPKAMNYTATRDTTEEYYTVYDMISGRTVTLDGRDIVCRMVYSEIGSTWPEDAIKAQAVAAYTYLRYNDSKGLIPTVGLKSGYPDKILRCVKAVEGQCVYYNGAVANTVYSASSAGYSLESQHEWGGTLPYLKAVVSKYDSEDPNYGVEVKFTEKQLRDIFEKHTDIKFSDDVENWFKAEAVYSKKYIGNMTVDGHTSCKVDGSATRLNGNTIRRLLGLKSDAFTIDHNDGVFTFTTYGFGHGVGMSQWGACLYARHGYTYDQILRHYYLGTTIKVSSVNKKAVERGKMTQEELDKEIANSEIIDDLDVKTDIAEAEQAAASAEEITENKNDTGSSAGEEILGENTEGKTKDEETAGEKTNSEEVTAVPDSEEIVTDKEEAPPEVTDTSSGEEAEGDEPAEAPDEPEQQPVPDIPQLDEADSSIEADRSSADNIQPETADNPASE